MTGHGTIDTAVQAMQGGALDYILESGQVEGLEALLRWQDTEDGLVPPSIFIPMRGGDL